MPTLTIKIAAVGTRLLDGEESLVGHMWYSLTDSNGATQSYGFSPVAGAPLLERVHGPGEVNAHGQDDDYYTGPLEYTRTVEITQETYEALR